MRHFPLVATLVVLWLTLGSLYFLVTGKTGGSVVYSLDDAYIHMAMAKNFSQHGQWGITGHEFSSASSSPLWTLVLSAVYAVFGVGDIAPLALNVVFASILVIALYLIFPGGEGVPRAPYTAASLIVIVFATELPALVFAGMEHTLQLVTALLFAHLGARSAAGGARESGAETARLLFCVLLATAVRYEGLFLAAAVCALLAVRGRIKISAAVAAAGLVPMSVYGMISASHGWYWLPNSVIIKAAAPDMNSAQAVAEFLLLHMRNAASSAPELLLLVLISLVLYLIGLGRKGAGDRYNRGLLVIFVLTASMQALLSRTGGTGGSVYYFRYEAYVMLLGLFAIFVNLQGHLPERASFAVQVLAPASVAAALMVSCSVYPFGDKSGSISVTPRAARNIYGQQYQMGLFASRYYGGGCVALNDIGAVNYLADIRCVDLVGLGSIEVARERLGDAVLGERSGGGKRTRLSAGQIAYLTRDADIAMIYEKWFQGSIPPHWEKIGEWEIPDNVACAYPTVAIYAVRASGRRTAADNFREFSRTLPPGVIAREMTGGPAVRQYAATAQLSLTANTY